MANLPLRGLGEVGLITDVAPYDLPIAAWSTADNVRFVRGRVRRAPAFREMFSTYDSVNASTDYPVHVSSRRVDGAPDEIAAVYNDGRIQVITQNGAKTDVTPAGFSPMAVTLPVTSTSLAEVAYINNPNGNAPLFYNRSTQKFEPIPGWDSTHTCRSLRSFKDFLIALNVTKNGENFPLLVKTSDGALAGQPPASWDHTDVTTNATENVITDLTTGIVDGGALRDSFIIYSNTETVLMELIGGDFLFSYRTIFKDAGIISQNCWVEVDGSHFVFGYDDIYIHDGISRRSIVDGRVRNAIFRDIDFSKLKAAFVVHNPALSEVMFCYKSKSSNAYWASTDKANKAAVYNYALDVWCFRDLPGVTSACLSEVSPGVVTFDTVNATFDNIGGSFADFEGGAFRNVIFAIERNDTMGISSGCIRAYDVIHEGRVAGSVDEQLVAPVKLSREYIDLDEIGVDLAGRKLVRGVYPQMFSFSDQPNVFGFRFGWADYPLAATTWGQFISFDARSNYKIDTRTFGRYLAYELSADTANDFEISGFDIDVVKISGR